MLRHNQWTNVEDEILKAAVMKYGLNQWDWISSLFPKKTTKQIKARWSDYLNPLLNKSNWTFEENKKLVELCKQFPNMWRTIGEQLNWTAYSCQ